MSTESLLTPEAIKTRLSNLKPEELKALQDIFHHRLRGNWLRSNGWLNIFLGGLTLWVGLTNPYEPTFLRLIQIVLGALIVGHCIWAIVSPTNSAIMRFAILFLVSGIGNVLLTIGSGLRGGQLLIGLLGVAQLWWAFQAYKDYQRYQQMTLPEPQADDARLYDETWKAIKRGAFKTDSGLIQLWIALDRWQALLLEDKVIFASKRQKILVFQLKDETNFIPNSTKPMGKRRVYGRIKLNAVFERALMKRDYFEKYSRWKGLDAILAEVTPTLWQRLPRVVRIVVMIIVGLILLYVGLIIVGVIVMLVKYS